MNEEKMITLDCRCYQKMENPQSIITNLTLDQFISSLQLIKNLEELNLISKCELTSCKSKDKITFYCEDCRQHICQQCKESHQKDHSLTNLEDYFSEENLEKYKKKINQVENQLNQPLEEIDAILKSNLAKKDIQIFNNNNHMLKLDYNERRIK